MAKDGDRPADGASKETRRAMKQLSKHLKRLQGELAAASRAEAKRLRKLEKARWRRQRIEAFIDEARAIAEMETGPSGPTAPPPAAPPLKAAPRPARAPRPATGATKPRPAAPGKPAR
jgi:hypothetical protein